MSLRSRLASSICRLIVVVVAIACGHHVTKLQAQNVGNTTDEAVAQPPGAKTDLPSSAGPYRRVFVRDDDLPLEGYRAMDLESFAALVEDRRKQTERLDPNSPNHDTELRSFHAQVRLLGADLVSDRSRLRWNWKSSPPRKREGIRKQLAPWNAAIDVSSRSNLTPPQSTFIPPAWIYDSNGLPSISVSSEQEWFSWTLRPLNNSSPNRLNFALSFPRTVDSCLVLQLPKSARIVDANIVVRQANNWNEVTERIGDWPVALAASESIPELNATDSFWLLELSGRDQASFSILLNPSRGIYDNMSSDDRSIATWNRLIARQTTSHMVSLTQVKTLCEWEWVETTTLDRSFRIRVPEGVRLRNLKLNDRETIPRYSDRVLELTIPVDESSDNTSLVGATRVRISAEFLSALPDLASDGIIKIPPIDSLNGYVVSGITSIASDNSIALTNINGGAGRLETIRNSNKSLERLEFSWFQSAPEISFSTMDRVIAHSAEILTRLSTDANRAVAFVKMQLSPWQISAPNRIRIAGGWSLETLQINHRGLRLSLEDPVPIAAATFLRIDPDGPVDDGPVQIELQLSRDISDSSGDTMQSESLIDLPERTTTQALVIEPGYAPQLEYYGDFYRDLCDEEMLTPWQRDRLPRLGRFLLFRMPDGRLPKLRPKADPPLIECSIATRLSDEGDRIRIVHTFDLNPGSPSVPSVDILLPGNWRWEEESVEGWGPLDLKVENKSDTWEWLAPAPTSPRINQETPSPSRHRFRASASLEKHKEPWALPFPRLVGHPSVTYSLHADPVFQIISDQSRGIWEFDESGRWFMRWQDPIPNDSFLNVTVREIEPPNSNRWWIPHSRLHLAIDTLGQQRAVLALDAQGLRNQPWEFSLNIPDGWSIERILDETSEATDREKRNSFEVRLDGPVHRILRQPAQSTIDAVVSEIRVVLLGPKCKPQTFLEWGILPTQAIFFSWPKISLDAQYPDPTRILWTPASMDLSGPPNRKLAWEQLAQAPLPDVREIWSAWQWTAEAASRLGWTGNHRDEESEASSSDAKFAIAPRELIPAWASGDWKHSYPSSQSPGQGSISTEPQSLRCAPSRHGPALWLVITLLIAYCLLPRAPWLCLFMAGVATVGGHWLPDSLAIWFRSTWVGVALGTLVYLIRWTTTSSGLKPADRDRPEPWHPWNEPGLSNDGLSDASGRAVVISSLGILLSMVISLPMLAQDIVPFTTPNRDMTFDVLIPLNEEGMPSGDVVYVPSSMVTPEEPSPSSAPVLDRDSYVISARHSLRFDARSISFGNTEQPCNHIYEVWVGETGVGRPWRIPFSTDRSRLSRFLIDGVEVASSRLAKSDSELVWYPDRMGRRILQIESQVRIRPTDSDKNESSSIEGLVGDPRTARAWSVDVPIVPSANAILEIETDAGWSVDFNRRGRMANPSIGKFSIQLGSQDRLTGEFVPDTILNIAGGGTIASDTGAIGSSELPQMNTELFIDRGQLLARTIVEYPRTVDSPDEIELESDLQWQPVGNLWGEAKLIDIRPGSTLDRRRYIVRWIPEVTNSQSKRVINTTWIPVGNANLRNVLFAECRDRRVRSNTLRYARSAGSVWMLEGINTWVPSINTKERIEWAELNERPIATSLRIPINGGFGVLRQQVDSKLQRSRVTHQMGISSAKISLKSRIEFANSVSNRRSLVASLPSQYSVVEAISKNTSLSHIEWVIANRRFIQVFADRETGDVNELVILTEQNISDVDTQQVAMPVLALEDAPIAEQFAEFSADPSWKVRFPTHASQAEFEVARGKGLGKPLASLSLLDFPESSNLFIQRLQGEWIGDITAKTLAVTDDTARWELRMTDNRSIDAKPTLIVSLPTEISRDWRNNPSVRELPSWAPNRRWFRIQPSWSDDQQNASFSVEWDADPKLLQDDRWIERLKFESDPQLKCVLSDTAERESGDPEAGKTESVASLASDDPREKHDRFELHQVVATDPGAERISLLSTWWIARAPLENTDDGNLAWLLPPGVQAHWVSINGEGTYWQRDGDQLVVPFPRSGIPLRVDLWTDSDLSPETLSSEESNGTKVSVPGILPQLQRKEGSAREGWLIVHGRIYDLEGKRNPADIGLEREICRRNIETLYALKRWQPKSEGNPGHSQGTWYRWKDYLMNETEALLLSWTKLGSPSDRDDYRAMVSSYLELASQTKAETLRPGGLGISRRLPSGMDAELYESVVAQQDANEKGSIKESAPVRLLATLCMGLFVVLAPWAWLTFGRPMQRKAWWPLILIGIGIWFVAGTWIPGMILSLIAFVLAVDSYLILNERFRQSGTRVPR